MIGYRNQRVINGAKSVDGGIAAAAELEHWSRAEGIDNENEKQQPDPGTTRVVPGARGAFLRVAAGCAGLWLVVHADLFDPPDYLKIPVGGLRRQGAAVAEEGHGCVHGVENGTCSGVIAVDFGGRADAQDVKHRGSGEPAEPRRDACPFPVGRLFAAWLCLVVHGGKLALGRSGGEGEMTSWTRYSG
jgi:hypothetical protein